MAVYWMTVSGAFHSIDEHSVFTVSRNLIYHARFDQSTLFWGTPYDEQARIGVDGELYAKYGIGHSLLVSVWIMLTRLIPDAGLASSAMLINSIATALTAFFLVLTAARLNYSHQVGISLGLFYGLATYAWIYAKTMFSEPLVALGWIVLVWLLLGQTTRLRVLIAGGVMAATISIRPVAILMALPFILLFWDRRPNELVRRLLAYGLPIVLVVLGLLAFNWQRFGDPFQFGYSETFNGSLLRGLNGFLFSLDRSIFLFAPPLIAIFWSFPMFVRQHHSLGWKLLVISGVTIVLYALWPVFWGGPVWGPRYLLPVLPLLMLLTLPAIDRFWTARDWSRWVMGLLVMLGVAIQLPGVIWNPLPATQHLGQRYPLWLLRPQQAWLDMAWLHARPQGLLLSMANMFLASIALLRPRRWMVVTAGVSLMLSSVVLFSWLGQTKFGYPERPAYLSTLARLKESGRLGDALLLNPALYQSPLNQLVWFLNAPDAYTPFFGVYRLPIGEDQPTIARVEHLLRTYSRLWLLTEGMRPGDVNSTTERALVDRAFFAGTEWLEDGFRLSLFEAPQPIVVHGSSGVLLGDVAILESWALSWTDNKPQSLLVVLNWQPIRTSSVPLNSFVQALDAQTGILQAVWDGTPQAGFAPVTAWQPYQPVTERIALMLPNENRPLRLRLIAGLYDPTTGQRLTTLDGTDHVTLTTWP
jgi:hypothetical protein